MIDNLILVRGPSDIPTDAFLLGEILASDEVDVLFKTINQRHYAHNDKPQKLPRMHSEMLKKALSEIDFENLQLAVIRTKDNEPMLLLTSKDQGYKILTPESEGTTGPFVASTVAPFIREEYCPLNIEISLEHLQALVLNHVPDFEDKPLPLNKFKGSGSHITSPKHSRRK